MKRVQRAFLSVSLVGLGLLAFSPVEAWCSGKEETAVKDEHGHAERDEHGHDDEGEEEGHGHGHEAEEGSSRIGPDKAITAATKKDGIQLAEKAVKRMGLGTLIVKEPLRVPTSSLVHYQGDVGIYRLRGGWYKLLEVVIVQKGPEESIVRSNEIQAGDQIVIKGVPLLRVADLEAWGGSGDGHGH